MDYMKVIHKDIRKGKHYVKYSLVECVCGNVIEIQNTRIGKQKSCIKCLSVTHGMSKTKFYRIWTDMKTRGVNRYSKKGDGGVGISSRWKKFKNFYDDMHEAYQNHLEAHGERDTTIDRIDNSKGYSLKNCRWATNKQQIKNRRNTLLINGKTLKEQCDIHNIPYQRAHQRLRRGWSFEKTFRK